MDGTQAAELTIYALLIVVGAVLYGLNTSRSGKVAAVLIMVFAVIGLVSSIVGPMQ